MSKETAEWIRRERENRGWGRPETARRIIKAAGDRDEKHVPDFGTVKHDMYRWEAGGGVSDLYVALLCEAFDLPYTDFPRQNRTRTKRKTGTALSIRQDSHVPDNGHMTYRERTTPSPGDFTVEQEVMMAAHESSDHAADYEQRGIGDVTFEQLRVDVIRLSQMTDSGSPLPAFLEARRVRDRIYRLLDRRLWPREQYDLYFLLGCVNALMGVNANRLGFPAAAEELLRAGWAYANAIDHNLLRGMLRERLSYVMYWRGRFREASDLAVDGLRYVSQGPLGAELHVCRARAAARLGDPDTARQSVGLAHAAREGDYGSELLDIGGEFAVSLATHHTQAGSALVDIGGAERDAEAEIEQAVALYVQGPGPGETHWFGGKALASADLAVVRLRSGVLDGVAAALEPVLILPPAQRVSSLTARLARVRDELAAPTFQDSPQARDLGDQIEEFSREAVTVGLHSLSG